MADGTVDIGPRPGADHTAPTIPASRPSQLLQQDSETMIVYESPMLDTPQQPLATPWLGQVMDADTPQRALTRSMTKNNPVMLLTGEEDSINTRLRRSVKRKGPSSVVHSLENSRSIVYDIDGAETEITTPSSPSRRLRGNNSSRGSRAQRVRRAKTVKNLSPPDRDCTPTTTAIVKAASDRVRKRTSNKLTAVARPPRRSARLAKPLTEFHLFGQLPKELQIMVWEAAIESRVVYLRNRSVFPPSYTRGIQNEQPQWFLACQTSWYVAQFHYRTMFGLLATITHPADYGHRQAMNANLDVVLLEPCCAGCRAYSCTRHQFSNQDRELVRQIAVQIESPLLMPSASPCWQTISMSWPNVETIYMTRQSFTGADQKPKALIRVAEDEHEKRVYQRFLQWKKSNGQGNKVQRVEFVVVVHREEGKLQDRYQSVVQRKSGDPSDIVIG
ncbi:uncharacterized protein B0I36DRAFT_109482 [Microdochium trichocladiopsis]|uniref:2EXR domain-containing protein n=1 Tax=Microdochium trichocladiopsis TaxID=1682393 RepID=A0A9P8Y793_9PEZI|nr:uncharacterized protein B0I36DRAFT_109482 [Microdochium trichocladiopsis]KAH7033465.1 hypothetical protein B0I36DRAFT_109482 [Microdochium trichocladiopsis]